MPLTDILGKGFSEANIRNFRQFYLTFPNGIQFARHRLANLENLSWSHWCALMRIDDNSELIYYLHETTEQNWKVKTLERNIRSGYYRRLLSTQKKSITDVSKKLQNKTDTTLDHIKDPYILEFLNVPEDMTGRETNLETAIINNLQSFLLELGKGFSFVARQLRISSETSHSCSVLVKIITVKGV